MLTRLRRWLTYRRHLARAWAATSSYGHVSAASYERMRAEARKAAGYGPAAAR